ncbi:MAG: hypothetical protein V4539_06085 [Bacteroidota bacterium]
MRPISSLLFFLGSLFSIHVGAQNPLPDLTVKELTRGKIQVSWYSPEHNCVQIAVQRSTDSSKNFRTIFSALSPELVNNGFVDNKPITGKAWYRLFYVIEGGAYFFTRAIMVETQPPPAMAASLPSFETARDITTIYLNKQVLFRLTKDEYKHFKDSINKTKDILHRIDANAVEWRPVPTGVKKDVVRIYQKDMLLAELDKKRYQQFKDSIKEYTRDTLFAVSEARVQLHRFVTFSNAVVFIYRNDSLLQQLDLMLYRKFRDSVTTQTKDTLFAKEGNRVEIHPFAPRYMWRPSQFIFTNSKGYLTVVLPLANRRKYHIIFYEEDGSELFRIKQVKETEFILDKTDFVHAGWFSFELFEDDKLKEKNKFFLTKE